MAGRPERVRRRRTHRPGLTPDRPRRGPSSGNVDLAFAELRNGVLGHGRRRQRLRRAAAAAAVASHGFTPRGRSGRTSSRSRSCSSAPSSRSPGSAGATAPSAHVARDAARRWARRHAPSGSGPPGRSRGAARCDDVARTRSRRTGHRREHRRRDRRRFELIEEGIRAMIITRTHCASRSAVAARTCPRTTGAPGSGFLIAAAITKYVYIAVTPQLRRRRPAEVLVGRADCRSRTMPSTRCCATCLAPDRRHAGIEVTSMADIPAGTGLGSSGSFTVGVLKALRAYTPRHRGEPRARRSRRAASRSTCSASRSASRTSTSPRSAGSRRSSSMPTRASTSCRSSCRPSRACTGSRTNLLLFYTGVRRSASEVLATQQARPVGGDGDRHSTTTSTEFGTSATRRSDALEAGDLDGVRRRC